jgi:IS5 family transposase
MNYQQESHQRLDEIIKETGLELKDDLKIIDEILDDDDITNKVYEACSKRYPKTKVTGRKGTPVICIFRMLVLNRFYNWSFEETEKFVSENIVLRKFCRIGLERVCDDTTLIRWGHLLTDELLKIINERLVNIAKDKRITKGRKLRVDTTCVETNIHYPTDSSLILDSVCKVTRVFEKVKDLQIASGKIIQNTIRSISKIVRNIQITAKSKNDKQKEKFKEQYKKLVATANKTLNNAKDLKRTIVNRAKSLGEETIEKAKSIKKALDDFVPTFEKVISQAKKRVIKEKSLSNSEKIISIHQPHSYVVKKGKQSKDIEFGQVVKIQEADGGIITDYESFNSQPADTELFEPSLDKHISIFNKPPDVVATDRGFSSEDNELYAKQNGVKYVAMPHKGKKTIKRTIHEKQRWFRKAQHFRAGSEGKISTLKRRFGLNKCFYNGQNGFDRWFGLSIICSNLLVIARTIT